MGVNERSYYWISCDYTGPPVGFCDAGDNLDDGDSDFTASQIAENAGFVQCEETGHWFCSSHAHLARKRNVPA